MADEFDVIDFVYEAVDLADTGLVIYKDNSPKGESNDHIVINHLQLNEFQFHTKTPVNINIFIKLASNGMVNRSKMRTVKDKVRDAVLKISVKDGKYRSAEIEFSERIKDIKEGFDCINIRILIITDK